MSLLIGTSAFLDISELPDVTKDGPGPEEDFLMEHGFSEGTGTVAKDTGEHEQSQNGYDKGEEKTTPTVRDSAVVSEVMR